MYAEKRWPMHKSLIIILFFSVFGIYLLPVMQGVQWNKMKSASNTSSDSQ